MKPRPDKHPQRLETRRRVEQKSQARNPSAGLDAELDQRVARDEDRCVALFCGSREWRDWTCIEEHIAKLPKTAVVIHGGQRGADHIAGALAQQHGLHVAAVHWRPDLFGKAAGPLRNAALMALLPTVGYAYPLPQSRGTWDMTRKLIGASVPVFVCRIYLKDAPSAKAPTSVARDAVPTATRKEPPQS